MKFLSAYRQQKNCEAEGVFVVEGVKMAQEALKSGWKIRTVCATAEEWNAMDFFAHNGADEVYEASREQIERLSSLRSPQGVWMLVERKTENGERRAESPFVLALDGIQDPGNMGAILRTCDWFGVRDVVCSHETVSCYNPKVVQASMGAIFRTHVSYRELAETLMSYKKHGFAINGAMLDGEDAFAARKERPCVLVIGNEGHGISPEVAAVIDRRLTIPNIGGTCESLNASVAAAILVSGFFRA